MCTEVTVKKGVRNLWSALPAGAIILAAVVLANVHPAITSAQSDTSPDCMGNYCKTMPHKGSPYLTGNCQPPKKGESPTKDGLVGKNCSVKGQKITVTGKCLPIQPKCKSVGDTGEKMMMPMGMPPMLPMPMPKMMMPMMMPMMPSSDPCQTNDGAFGGTGSSSPGVNCPQKSLWGSLLEGAQDAAKNAGGALGEIANSAKRLIIGPVQQVAGPDTVEKKDVPPVITVVGGETATLGPDGKSKDGSQSAATSPDLSYGKFNTGPTGFGGPAKAGDSPENTSVLDTMLLGLKNALAGILGLLQ